MVNEAGRHGGALNMLKAITGGDHLPLERKHQQQSGSFLFSGLVLMATNEDLQSTDATSGLERRRITVRFPRSATAEEIADWDAQGGEQAVLHVEIPGLINWLLAMPEAEIKTRIGSPPLRVATDNMLGMAAGNSVADWMLSNTMPDPDAWTQIGVKKEGRERETGQTYFENADEWLYANYLAWCLESGRSRPVALRKFRDTVADMAETLGCPVHQGRHPQSRAYSIKGLRFVRKDDPSETKDRWKAKGQMEPAFRKDRKDGR
jgi:putative DNA primase/helicase